jgi:hypothetical protein
MSSARHFFKSGTLSDDQLKTDITADLKAARGAQQQAMQHGQYRSAELMRGAVDEHLDELNDLKQGRWRPRHA